MNPVGLRLHTRRHRATGLRLVHGAVLLAAIAGCDRADEATTAIENARLELAAMHAGGVAPASDEARLASYASAIQTLQPAASSGGAGQQSAAQRLIAHAYAGQGQIAANSAIELERDALNDIGVLRSLVDNAVVFRLAHAAASESVSTVSMQSEVESQVREIETEQGRKREDLRMLQDQVASLNQRLSQATAEAQEHRARENDLRSQALSADVEARADIIADAVAAQRQADGAERRVSEAQAELAVLEPQMEQINRELESLGARIDLLRDSRQRMASLDQTLREVATADRQSASDSYSAIDARLRRLDDFRAREVADAYADAISKYDAAVSAMRRATSGAELRSTIMIAIGGFEQSIGDLHSARAVGLDRYASLLRQLISEEAALPERGTYQQFLARVESSRDEAAAAAAAAYQESLDAFESAGARGETADRVDRLVAALRERQGDAPTQESFESDDES